MKSQRFLRTGQFILDWLQHVWWNHERFLLKIVTVVQVPEILRSWLKSGAFLFWCSCLNVRWSHELFWAERNIEYEMWDKTLGERRSIAFPWNVVLMSHESNLKEAEVNVKSQQSLMATQTECNESRCFVLCPLWLVDFEVNWLHCVCCAAHTHVKWKQINLLSDSFSTFLLLLAAPIDIFQPVFL